MLRLEPHLSVFRSAPDRITIGGQHPVAELDADGATLRAIAALSRGVLPRELEQLIGEGPAQTLLAAIEPAIVADSPAIPILVRGRVQLAERLHRAARDTGHPAGDDGVIVPVALWRLPQAEVERLLISGAAHLPVVIGDCWLQVGPFVPAGTGCARCALPKDGALLPAHLSPEASPIAAAQCVVTVLEALRRASEESLPEGWGVRIRQRDAAVSALRRRRPCSHRGDRPLSVAVRSLPGIATAA